VTSEEDFQNALDANPEDHLTRLVFADWLEERGDPRAEGYRALGMNRLQTEHFSADTAADSTEAFCWWHQPERSNGSRLVRDWWEELRAFRPVSDNYRNYNTRREAEDAAALAFARLSAARRTELLAGTGTEPKAGKRKKKPKPKNAKPKKGKKP
jgi:uncharacterized protein (TIGR02996 family)